MGRGVRRNITWSSQGHVVAPGGVVVVDRLSDADVYGTVRQYAGNGHPTAAAVVAVRATAQRGVGRMLFEPERALLEHEHGHDGGEHERRGRVHERQVHQAGDVQRAVAPRIGLVQRRRLRVGPVHGQYPIVAQREPAGQERGQRDGRDPRAHRRHHVLARPHVRPPALVVPQRLHLPAQQPHHFDHAEYAADDHVHGYVRLPRTVPHEMHACNNGQTRRIIVVVVVVHMKLLKINLFIN